MYREVAVKTLPLTPELARHFANMDDWRGERPLRPARLAHIESLLRTGRFYSPEWAVAKLGKKRIRVNGQHSSTVLARLNGNFPANLTVVVREYDCDTDEDVAHLFGTFDSYHSVRSSGDLVNAHSSIYPALESVAATNISYALSGIAVYANSGETRKIDREERVSLLHSDQNRRFIAWAVDFIRTRSLSRSGTVAGMYATWLKDEYEATVFWTAVKHENDPNPAAASRILARFLRENTTNVSRNARGDKTTWPPRAFYVKTLHAWNAYRRGETTILKYHANAEIPSIR